MLVVRYHLSFCICLLISLSTIVENHSRNIDLLLTCVAYSASSLRAPVDLMPITSPLQNTIQQTIILVIITLTVHFKWCFKCLTSLCKCNWCVFDYPGLSCHKEINVYHNSLLCTTRVTFFCVKILSLFNS